ncbi:hypothetical protein V1521DRAFT_437334 [Lipomyces starkeyi]
MRVSKSFTIQNCKWSFSFISCYFFCGHVIFHGNRLLRWQDSREKPRMTRSDARFRGRQSATRAPVVWTICPMIMYVLHSFNI